MRNQTNKLEFFSPTAFHGYEPKGREFESLGRTIRSVLRLVKSAQTAFYVWSRLTPSNGAVREYRFQKFGLFRWGLLNVKKYRRCLPVLRFLQHAAIVEDSRLSQLSVGSIYVVPPIATRHLSESKILPRFCRAAYPGRRRPATTTWPSVNG